MAYFLSLQATFLTHYSVVLYFQLTKHPDSSIVINKINSVSTSPPPTAVDLSTPSERTKILDTVGGLSDSTVAIDDPGKSPVIYVVNKNKAEVVNAVLEIVETNSNSMEVE